MPERFEGILPVLPTPLNEDETIDYRGLCHLVDFFIAAGMHGLVVLGSGGEYPYFTLEEKVSIARAAADACGGRVPLIAGARFPSLREIPYFWMPAAICRSTTSWCPFPSCSTRSSFPKL